MPSKTLLRPGDVLAAARRVPGALQAVTGSVDAAAAFAQRDYMTSGWDDSGQVPWLDGKQITLVRGTGRLAGPRTVTVFATGGEEIVLSADRVVLATGTVPALPSISGLGDVGAWTNRDVTAAKQVPPRLLVLGGGAIGAEMAQAFRRLGSAEVTIVEAADRLLGGCTAR
jgi:dihydrolipoamide dehydrogenase